MATDTPLSDLQRDILELEARTWKQDGAKISEFRRRWPNVTETGYYVALGRLLEDRRAYEHGNNRYAGMLNRLLQAQDDRLIQRMVRARGAAGRGASSVVPTDQ